MLWGELRMWIFATMIPTSRRFVIATIFSTSTAVDGTYPVARPLFMYTNGAPQGQIKVYLDWILSDAGQCIIQDKGYAPVRSLTCE